eukprot:3415078-Rhodomonas_salina.1
MSKQTFGHARPTTDDSQSTIGPAQVLMAVAVAWSARGSNSPEEPFMPDVDASPKRKEPQHTAEGSGTMVTPLHREHRHRVAQPSATPTARRRLGTSKRNQDTNGGAGRGDMPATRQPESERDEAEEEVQLPDTATIWEAAWPQHDALATELTKRGLRVVY